MKKQLNVDMIQSELRGGSAFFPGYKGHRSPALPTPDLHDIPPASADSTETTPDLLIPKLDAYKPDKHTGAIEKQGVPPPVPRTVPRTDSPREQLVPKSKRPMKQRQPFDIYEDQYMRLKQIADSERGFVNGRGMSQMVREAIDSYLTSTSSTNKK